MKPPPEQFHLWINGQATGPFTFDELEARKMNGGLDRRVLACRVGSEEWIAIEDHPFLRELFEPKPFKASDVPAVSAVKPEEEWINYQGGLGWALVLIGVLLMLVGAFKSTSVETSSGSWPSVKKEAVNNIGLISDRETMMLFGGALFVGGCVLATARRER